MKLSLETIFNDSGIERDVPLKQLFLGQRKWIILCATFVFLLSHGYIALSQNWLFFNFDINARSLPLLRTVSGACLLFGAYMFFTAYAFLKKHRIEQRRRFDELEIEERDTVSIRIEELNAQKDKIEEALKERQLEKRSLFVQARDLSAKLAQVQSLKGNVFSSGLQKVPEAAIAILNENISQRKNALAAFNEFSRAEVEEALWRLGTKLQEVESQLSAIGRSEITLNKDFEQLSSSISIAEKDRSDVNTANNSEWAKFYRGRVIADALSLLPALFAVIYCGSYLVSSYLGPKPIGVQKSVSEKVESPIRLRR